MFEIHRQTYLHALGIDNYVPKWQLAGAPKSNACEFIAPEIDPSQQQDHQDNSTDNANIDAQNQVPNVELNNDTVTVNANNSLNTNSTAKSAKDIIQEISNESPARLLLTPDNPIQPSSAPKESKAPFAESKAPMDVSSLSKKAPSNFAKTGLTKTVSEKIQFSLNFWRISDDLMVVDSRQAELALPTEKLLVNMLFALGYPRELPKSEIIRWPLIDAPGQPQDENAARETLNAFLDEQFLLRPGKFMLLMGEDAAQYLLTSDVPFEEQLHQQHIIETFSLTAIVTPNLAHLLQQPEAKADVWRCIQPLRQ